MQGFSFLTKPLILKIATSLLVVGLSLGAAHAEEVQNISSSSVTTEVDKSVATAEEVETTKDKVETSAESTAKDNVVELEKESGSQKLATIDVTGVDSELKKNIELHMPVTIPECNADRGDVRQFFTTVKKHLRKASRALGYYDAEFVSGGKIVDGCWALRLRITPGKPSKIVSQSISVVGEGSNLPIFKKLLSELPYKVGDVLNHDLYSTFKTNLSEAAQARGFFDAEFLEHNIRVNPLAHQASVNLKLNTGKRYRYGEVTVEQDVLDDKTIQNYLVLRSGEPYKTEDLLKQQQLLQQSGYFKTINIEVLRDQASNAQVPVHISLSAKKRNAYKLRAGYGSDTGPRVIVEMNRRWTGRGGKQFKTLAQYSQKEKKVSLNLLNPQKKPEDDTLVYTIDWVETTEDSSESQVTTIGGKFTRKTPNDWVQSASLGLSYEETNFYVDDDFDINATYLLLGLGLEKTKADNLLFPLNGWRLKYETNFGSKAILSDQDVFQLKISGKHIKSVSNGGRILSRFDLGSTVVNDFSELPQSLRFYSGGQNSVRGYGFHDLGEIESVKDTDTGEFEDINIGGRNLLNLSLEYQHPINDQWSAAVFVDAGNAFDDWGNYSLEVGTGFGARWKSPIGPVRIDLGFPEKDDNFPEVDFKNPTVYLSVGSDL